MTAWRAALRLARRDALRHRWRSLLIVVLILAPVAAATGVDIIYRTQTSAERNREEAFGGADAIIQQYSGNGVSLTENQIRAALPEGSRAVFERWQTQQVITTAGHVASSAVRLTDRLDDPLTRADAQLVSGHAPGAGNEVAVSAKLARKLGLPGNGIGATITLRDGVSAKVVGIVRDPFCLSCPLVVASPGSEFGRSVEAKNPVTSGAYYVDLPDSLDDAGRAQFASRFRSEVAGGDVILRQDYLQYELGLRDLRQLSGSTLRVATLITLVAGLGLLEVILLAGTAFAVGARRQTRDLGLLAAQGGSPRDLRRVVLAQGLLLGVLGSAAGIAAAYGGFLAARPLFERINDAVLVGVHAGAVEITVVVAVGIASGLAAALIPAIGASRRRTVDALASRFPVPTARSRWAPVFGGVLIAGGVGISLLASYLMTSGDNGWFAYGPIEGITPPVSGRLDGTDGAIAILLGVFVVVGGLLSLAPAFLAGLARLAGRMPATLRLATRDAARHRHRTGPATAAIAVAVGGAVAISCLIASDQQGTGLHDASALPDRSIAIARTGAVDENLLEPGKAAVKEAVPDAQVLQVRVPVHRSSADGESVSAEVQVAPPEGAGPSGYVGFMVEEGRTPGAVTWVGVGDDPDLVVLASGRTADRDAVADALNGGKALVFDDALLDEDGRVALAGGGFDANGKARDVVRLPAVVLEQDTPYSELPDVFVPMSAVERHGWTTEVKSTVVSYPDSAREQASAAVEVVERSGITVLTGGDERDHTRLLRVGLSAGSALIGLLGVAMCVALSAAEGRPDLATLSAIGAPPSRRRRLAGAQALVLAALGSALGLAFGFYFARAARPATGAAETVVPWGDLLLTVAAVPLLAVLVAALGSLGRVPLTRRAD